MKAFSTLLLLLACGIVAHAQEAAKSPLEGTWEFASMTRTENGKAVTAPSATFAMTQLKMYSKGHFMYVGRYKEGDKPVGNNYGGGTYTLNGEDYTETALYHTHADLIGGSLHFKVVVKGDTMTMTGPIDTEEAKHFRSQFTEVYRKLD